MKVWSQCPAIHCSWLKEENRDVQSWLSAPQYLHCAYVFAVLSFFPKNFIPLSSIFTFLLVLQDIIVTFISRCAGACSVSGI